MRHRVRYGRALSVALLVGLPGAVLRAAPPIGVADALETTHIVAEDNLAEPDRPIPVSISPNGRRFVVRLATGDIARNGIRLDVLAGSLDTLDGASGLK